jgi:hypothetical protein
LRYFYFECSNLKYLTGLINVPKLGPVGRILSCCVCCLTCVQEAPNLLDSGDAPYLPACLKTAKTPPPAAPSLNQGEIDKQARMLNEYADQQANLQAAREAEELRPQAEEAQRQREFDQRKLEQLEKERLAAEQLRQQQMMQYSNVAAHQAGALGRELLAMRSQYERDQLLLEEYDQVSFCAPPLW